MGAGNFQLQGSNLDHLGNQVYPAVDRATIIEKDNYDEKHRALLGAVRTETGNYTIVRTDSLIKGDTPIAGQTLTLPDITLDQQTYTVKKKTGSSVAPLTVAADASDDIEGLASINIYVPGESITFVADLTNNTWEMT